MLFADLLSLLRARQAVEPLATFLDYCTYGYMIDNVVLIVAGTLHERDMADLLAKCHPLGLFDSIATLAVATTMRELYRLVLVDTPLAPYFSGCARPRARARARSASQRARTCLLTALPPFPL